ncbi:MAG: amino acid--tRNA ligase-related protein, partial [Planctomycetota bacterium]
MLRSHTCNEARAADEGQEMVLVGWVDSLRDHGGVRFLDLRDRYGRTQVTLHPDRLGERFALDQLRCEQVVQVRGVVRLRPEGMQNPRLDTGKVELEAVEVEVLGDCPPLPFDLSETAGEVGEELRFRYRYLDMRRDSVKDRFIFRSNLLHSMRDFLHREGFVELETPVLTKSTPEGARDFLVPSRISPGPST